MKIRFLPTDDELSLRGDTLKQAIQEDRARGLVPFLVCVFETSMGHFCREFKNPHIVLNLVAYTKYLTCATIPITFLKAYTNAAVYKNQNRQTVASANQCLCLIFLLHGKHRCMQKLFCNLFF